MDYDGMRLCGVEDTLGVGSGMCRWPQPDVSWSIIADLPGWGREALQAAIESAFAGWSKVCGLRPVFRGFGERSNITIGVQTIGPGQVLADCELPCGYSMGHSARMRIDTAEAWVNAENPPSNRVDLVRTVCHELGHGIGIPHIGGGNLMAPTYSSQIRWPLAGDIAEAVARYGLPAANPNPAPVDPMNPPVDDGFTELAALLLDRNGKLVFRLGGKVVGQ